MLEVVDLERLAAVAEIDHVAGRARRRDRGHFVERELALGEDVQHLAPDIAGRADDRDPITHFNLLWIPSLRAARLSQARGESDMAQSSRAHKGGSMRRDTLLALAARLLLLAALAAKSLLDLRAAASRSIAAGEFDAMRAKARLAFILGDQRPHPADTPPTIRCARGSLRRFGRWDSSRSSAISSPATTSKRRGSSPAPASATSSRSLGPATGKALLLNAHYDSVPVGPGAADDGIGVATLLEVGSILKDRPLKRPVILLFNEGEELGWSAPAPSSPIRSAATSTA